MEKHLHILASNSSILMLYLSGLLAGHNSTVVDHMTHQLKAKGSRLAKAAGITREKLSVEKMSEIDLLIETFHNFNFLFFSFLKKII